MKRWGARVLRVEGCFTAPDRKYLLFRLYIVKHKYMPKSSVYAYNHIIYQRGEKRTAGRAGQQGLIFISFGRHDSRRLHYCRCSFPVLVFLSSASPGGLSGMSSFCVDSPHCFSDHSFPCISVSGFAVDWVGTQAGPLSDILHVVCTRSTFLPASF